MLSGVYLIISYPFWLPFPLGEDFPNCVSARWDNDYYAVGAMSQNRMSSLFITRYGLEPGLSNWTERRDGHFCNFEIPTSYHAEPAFFNVVVSDQTLGWNCPYLIMFGLWGWVYLRNRKRDGLKQYSIFDVLIAMTLIAVIIASIQMRFQLILTVTMNLLTFGLAAYLVYETLKYMLVMSVPWLTPEPN